MCRSWLDFTPTNRILCRARLDLKPVVAVAILARALFPRRLAHVRDDIAHEAIALPLLDVAHLVGQLRVVEWSPGEDPPVDRDRQPIRQKETLPDWPQQRLDNQPIFRLRLAHVGHSV